ncbi:hypothetical protein Drose_14490 [Dactylosporangium roseum]|uniref:Uncharacterized protein n=1 Tax=Dactylosporangium roseum TaxID=47989 RepID=A0ABY5ZB60_9ACTN|nr:hypothetical protein [Dactylosporangium roseum]UWZ39336.1 hypothetical protein Drose_14490 [Dactylosporangium roseum]
MVNVFRRYLMHLVVEDQGLLLWISGVPPTFSIVQNGSCDISDLHSAWTVQGEKWRDVVPRVDELHATLPARGRRPEVSPAEDLILLESDGPILDRLINQGREVQPNGLLSTRTRLTIRALPSEASPPRAPTGTRSGAIPPPGRATPDHGKDLAIGAATSVP